MSNSTDAAKAGTVASAAQRHVAAPVRVEHITRRFDLGTARGNGESMLALDDISFEVPDGEFLSIIGPSGSGKTTLLRIIASLVPSDSGVVYVNGVPTTEPGPERAMVFQQFGLFPWKTVLENVAFPLTLKNMPIERAHEIARAKLRSVGLKPRFEDNHPHQLSGGMQQRVGLARALATDAQILLMDEPFGAIDAQTREILQADLSRLCAESGKTVILVTHDIDEAVLLSDRILVMTASPGRISEFVEVDLPHRRWEYDVRTHPSYAAIRSRVWNQLRSQIAIDTEDEEAR